MSIITEYGLDLPARAYVLLALSMEDKARRKSMDILHTQKIIRYYEFLRQKNDIEYSNFHLGGVSFELQENLETLCESGLVAPSGNRFELTKEGERAAEELRAQYGNEELRKLLFSKQLLNDLSSDELMFFMYKLLPETQTNSTEYHRLEKKDKELVQSLFAKGRINATTVAKWLGLSESDFLASLTKRK
jgi:hypothetical protein